MKDPKAIRRAIMAAKSIAAMVDPHFARVPLPDLGEPAPDMAMPEPEPQQFSMGGSAPKRSDDPFAKFHSQDPWLRHLPDHQYAAGGGVDDHVVNNPMSVFPKPQRMWDEDMPGGAYLSMPDKADVTGHRAAQASIGIGEGGKPYFHASRDEVDETGTPGKGSALVKTNLFKQKAGWRWLQAPEGHDDTGTIVSVEHRGNHHYVMDAHFPNGVDLSRYPDLPSEPRLRPTTRGNVELGPQVGSILVRGREHPVHSHAIVREYGGRVGYADGGMPDDEQEITGYHGSANEFPEFIMGARSRGQGQSAFGEGHNFAEDEDIARRYRNMTAREQMQGDVVHKRTGEALPDDAPEAQLFKDAVRYGDSDLSHKALNVPRSIALHEKRIQEYEDYRDQAKDDPWIDKSIAEMREEIDNLRRFSEIANTHKFVPKGHMYEVGLRVNPSKLLKWHEPVEAQPEAVQRYLVENDIEPKADWVGRDIYHHLSKNPEAESKFLSSEKHSGKFANQILHGLGVHGIKWKDTDSQIAPGRGKSNYTIWDDSRVNVRKRYALGGMPDDDTPNYAAPDDMGLYSHAAATAASLPQAKASPAEFRGMLTNRGVKPSEMEWSGYDQAFANQPQVTREQVAAHFHENKTPIEEKVLRDKPSKEDMRKVTEAHKIRSMDYHDRANQAMAAGLSGEFDPGGHEYAQMSRDYQRERMELKDKYGKPQYEDYTIPGGENYREILLKHKRDGAAFSSSHFNDEPNILTHLRMKDRYDTDNSKILHLDELQSDWAQQGRKEGFAGGDSKKEVANHQAAIKDHEDFMQKVVEHEVEGRIKAWESAPGRGPFPEEKKELLTDIVKESVERYLQSNAERVGLGDEYQKVSSALRDAREALYEAKDRMYGGVKSAPYVTSTNDWVDLGLKRALLEAAKGGHDKLALTQGKEAADRYDLSKHVAKIDYIKHRDADTGYLLAHGHDRPNIISQPVAVKDLPDMIGKDVAEKLLAATPETNGEQNTHSLEGLDLKVGGEGMRKFYDDILPKRLMRLAKTHDPDAKLSSSTINHPMDFDEEEQPDDDQTNLHALEITPRMRESILKKGFAAYASGGAVGEAQDADEHPDMLQLPVAKIFQIISMAGSGDPAADPEKFKEYLKKAQYALARKTTTKGSDVLKASPGAANVKMSEFGKPLEEMESTTVSKGMMLPRKEADLEAMQRRKARIFPFLGDMSPADRILLKSGSLALVDPSEQQGGSDFMRSEFAKGIDPAAYGNRIGAAKTLAKKIASQTPEGTPAVGTHVAMGLGSVDSSHHAYEPILRMIPNSPIAQRHIEEFDDMMHEALPPSNKYPMAWPGIMNTKEAEQFFASRPGTHASFFAKKIDSSKWQKAGFPDIGEMRFSASNPEILGNPRMSTGHAFSEVEPSGRVIESPDLKHRTYPALIPAEGEGYLGGSSVPIPPKLMFRDFYKSLKTKDRSGKAIDYDSPAGQTLAQQSLMTKVPYQDATQEWLDNIMEDRRQKQEQGFKKGGKVRSALMIAKGMKNR